MHNFDISRELLKTSKTSTVKIKFIEVGTTFLRNFKSPNGHKEDILKNGDSSE